MSWQVRSRETGTPISAKRHLFFSDAQEERSRYDERAVEVVFQPREVDKEQAGYDVPWLGKLLQTIFSSMEMKSDTR